MASIYYRVFSEIETSTNPITIASYSSLQIFPIFFPCSLINLLEDYSFERYLRNIDFDTRTSRPLGSSCVLKSMLQNLIVTIPTPDSKPPLTAIHRLNATEGYMHFFVIFKYCHLKQMDNYRTEGSVAESHVHHNTHYQ